MLLVLCFTKANHLRRMSSIDFCYLQIDLQPAKLALQPITSVLAKVPPTGNAVMYDMTFNSCTQAFHLGLDEIASKASRFRSIQPTFLSEFANMHLLTIGTCNRQADLTEA